MDSNLEISGSPSPHSYAFSNPKTNPLLNREDS